MKKIKNANSFFATFGGTCEQKKLRAKIFLITNQMKKKFFQKFFIVRKKLS